MAEDEKKNVTFSIPISVKRDFQIEVINNESDMSEVITTLMGNYTRISRKLKADQEKPVIPLVPEEEPKHTGRLSFEKE